MNPYHLDQFQQIMPNYYYNSPFEENKYQEYLNKRAETNEAACQTIQTIDYDMQPYSLTEGSRQRYDTVNQIDNQLLDLIETDLSIIELSKQPNFKPFGRICQPSFSIFINSCQVKVVLAKVGRLKSNILLVPYAEDQLSSYIGVLFKRSMLSKIQTKLKSKPAQGFISYTTSTLKSKFDIFAFTRLQSNLKNDYLAAIDNLLRNAKDLENSCTRQIVIPYSAEYECPKELMVLVLGYVQNQKESYFTEITINCEKAQEFKQLSLCFNEAVKRYLLKDDLTV